MFELRKFCGQQAASDAGPAQMDFGSVTYTTTSVQVVHAHRHCLNHHLKRQDIHTSLLNAQICGYYGGSGFWGWDVQAEMVRMLFHRRDPALAWGIVNEIPRWCAVERKFRSVCLTGLGEWNVVGSIQLRQWDLGRVRITFQKPCPS